MATVLTGAARGEWSWPNGRAGLILLLQAHECALAANSEIWDFAVEIGELRDRGMCENELRWMLKMGYLEHRIEATLLGDNTRCYLPQGGVKFSGQSCFVLTLVGECYVRTLLHPSNGHGSFKGYDGSPVTMHHGNTPAGHVVTQYDLHRVGGSSASESIPQHGPILHPGAAKALVPVPSPSASPKASLPERDVTVVAPEIVATAPAAHWVIPKDQKPSWDTERKELWFGPHLIKRFRFQSPNQEMILAVFHEENWPVKIDDPLPPVPNQTSRQRLHDAIKNLNRHRLSRMIRFAGDGTGEGVRWEREG